jgi:quercetin dioxygenase-like cupin family protein
MPFIDANQLKVKEPLPGWKGRYFHSDHMTFAYYTVEAGASIHEHSHPNEETWHFIEGEFEVTLDGQKRVCGPGSAAVVPANTVHRVTALSAARAIVVDHPRRDSVGGIRIG